jgi:hypothetical protein
MSSFNKSGKVDVYYTTTTIASSGTTSTAIDLYGYSLVGIVTPAALTGTSFTIKGSVDNSTYVDMYDTAGTQLSITAAASRFIAIAPQDFTSVRYIKLVSGSSEGAERTITLAIRKL